MPKQTFWQPARMHETMAQASRNPKNALCKPGFSQAQKTLKIWSESTNAKVHARA